jgi:hypothetical protein
MKKHTTKIILAFGVLSLALVVWGVLDNLLYSNPSNKLVLNDVLPIFHENIGAFTDFAQEIAQQTVVHSICRGGREVYTINGDVYDTGRNQFGTGAGTPLASGQKMTFEELLQVDHITKNQFDRFKQFMDDFPQMTCVEIESSGYLPTPTPKVYMHPPAVRFVITYHRQPIEGLLYVADLPIGDGLDSNYTKSYQSIEAIPGTKWFTFRR